MKRVLYLAAAGVACFLSDAAHAQQWTLAGHGKYMMVNTFYDKDDVGAETGGTRQTLQNFNVRLSSQYQTGKFVFDAHYDANFAYIENESAQLQDIDRQRLFDLSSESTLSGSYQLVQRMDRLNIGYFANKWVVKLGRQAVSWGNGFFYQPMDIFNPFSPLAIDKDYKTGDDMAYGQWVINTSNDVQFIYVPRRDDRREVVDRESSYVIKSRSLMDFGDIDFLLARHYADEIAGIGFTHAIKETLWRIDVTLTHLSDDDIQVSYITNLDYSWVTLGHNVYGFVEYFHNAFGVDSATAEQPMYLTSRLQRGELYTTMQDYLAFGLQIEMHPLVMLSPSLLFNLNDQSGLLPITLTYSWQQDLNLILSGTFPFGAKNTEYGSPLTPGKSVTMLLAYYF